MFDVGLVPYYHDCRDLDTFQQTTYALCVDRISDTRREHLDVSLSYFVFC